MRNHTDGTGGRQSRVAISLYGKDASENAAFAVFPFGDREVDVAKGAVLEESNDITTSADDLGLTGSEIALDVLIMVNGVVFGHEHLDILADDFGQ